MNNSLAAFIQSRPEGLLDSTDLQTLVSLDPFCPVRVECGPTHHFTTPARNVAHFIALIERDDREQVSAVRIDDGAIHQAKLWRNQHQPWPKLPEIKPITTKLAQIPAWPDLDAEPVRVQIVAEAKMFQG